MRLLSVRTFTFSILSLSLFCAGLVSSNVHAANVAGLILKVKGSVFVKRSKGRTEAKKNAKLFEGDVIDTEGSGRIKIRLAEGGNEVVLGANTSMQIQRVGQRSRNSSGTELKLQKGSIRSSVRKKYSGEGSDVFQVKTPNAVAGVRGTVFLVSFDPSIRQSLLATERGAVAWKSRGREMLVAKGMYASVVGQSMSALKSIRSNPVILKKVNAVRKDAGEKNIKQEDLSAATQGQSSVVSGNGGGRNDSSVGNSLEIDETGNTIVVENESQKQLKRGPASVGREVSTGEQASNKKRNSLSLGGIKPTIRVDIINQKEIDKNVFVKNPNGTVNGNGRGIRRGGGLGSSGNIDTDRINGLVGGANDTVTTNPAISIRPARVRIPIGGGGDGSSLNPDPTPHIPGTSQGI